MMFSINLFFGVHEYEIVKKKMKKNDNYWNWNISKSKDISFQVQCKVWLVLACKLKK